MSNEKLNRDAMLMMYLADEMPQEQRAEFQKEIAQDEALNAELAELSSAQNAVDEVIAKADAQSVLPISENAAARRMSRLIQQWQVDRAHRPVTRTVHFWNRSYPRWAYASVAAAVFMFGFLSYWALKPESSHNLPGSDTSQVAEDDSAQQDQVADRLQKSFEPNESIVTLARAEGEASNLSADFDEDMAQ